MTPDDDDITPEERAEAEALRRALDTGHAPGAIPDDALETEALLRYARDGGALDPARADAILDDVFARARPRAASRRRFWPFFGFVGLGAAAAAAVLAVRSEPGPTRLPAPPPGLLAAQMDAARSRAEGLDEVGRRMAPYLREVLAALGERYRE